MMLVAMSRSINLVHLPYGEPPTQALHGKAWYEAINTIPDKSLSVCHGCDKRLCYFHYNIIDSVLSLLLCYQLNGNEQLPCGLWRFVHRLLAWMTQKLYRTDPKEEGA